MGNITNFQGKNQFNPNKRLGVIKAVVGWQH